MLLTIKQFSIQYSIPLETVYRHIHKGILPSQQIGKGYLVDSDSLIEYQKNLENLDREKESSLGGKPRKFLLKAEK